MAANEEERRGWEEIRSGALDAAEHHFRRALELDPHRVDALNGLGTVYLSWGEFEEARELFQLAVMQARYRLPQRRRLAGGWKDEELRPYLRGLYQLAVSFIRQRLWVEAVRPLEEILTWDEDGIRGEVYYRLGQIALHLGDNVAAVERLKRTPPQHPFACYLLALAYLQEGREAEADRMMSRAVIRHPEIAPLLIHYPAVMPIPAHETRDLDFRRLIRFVEETAELWDQAARDRLQEHLAALAAHQAER